MKILKFVDQESKNLVDTIQSQEPVLHYVEVLGQMWDEAIAALEQVEDDDDIIILSLMQYARTYMNLTFANLMRHHMSFGLAAARNACDATMQAFRIMAQPDSGLSYLKGESTFSYTPKWVGKQLNATESENTSLAVVHSMFGLNSKYGAHADVSSMFGRINMVEDGPNMVHSYSHFQAPASPADMTYLLCTTTSTFIAIIEVFWPFLLRCARLKEPEEYLSRLQSVGHSVGVLREQNYDPDTPLA